MRSRYAGDFSSVGLLLFLSAASSSHAHKREASSMRREGFSAERSFTVGNRGQLGHLDAALHSLQAQAKQLENEVIGSRQLLVQREAAISDCNTVCCKHSTEAECNEETKTCGWKQPISAGVAGQCVECQSLSSEDCKTAAFKKSRCSMLSGDTCQAHTPSHDTNLAGSFDAPIIQADEATDVDDRNLLAHRSHHPIMNGPCNTLTYDQNACNGSEKAKANSCAWESRSKMCRDCRDLNIAECRDANAKGSECTWDPTAHPPKCRKPHLDADSMVQVFNGGHV